MIPRIERIEPVTFDLRVERIFDMILPRCRYLGNQDKFRNDARQIGLAENAASQARELVDSAGLFGIFSEEEIKDWPGMSKHSLVVIGLCTTGSRIVRQIADLNSKGRLAESVYLDAAASAVAELVCDTIDREAGSRVTSMGLVRTRRVSPGFPGYPIQLQKQIFDRLPAQQIRVRLTPSLMMDPIKSISFFFAAGSEPEIAFTDNPCAECPAVQCPFRKTITEE